MELRVERRRQGSASSCRWLREEGNSSNNGGDNSSGRNNFAENGYETPRDNPVNVGGNNSNGSHANHALVPHVSHSATNQGSSLSNLNAINAVVRISEVTPRSQGACIPLVAARAQRAAQSSMLI